MSKLKSYYTGERKDNRYIIVNGRNKVQALEVMKRHNPNVKLSQIKYLRFNDLLQVVGK